jgi:Subtilase family
MRYRPAMGRTAIPTKTMFGAQMMNLLLTTDGRSPVAVEAQLRTYLPGLDTRLFNVGPTQAVLRAPLIRALDTDYPSVGAGRLLLTLGVARMDPIDDETSSHLVMLRDREALPPRRRARAPVAVAGADWHLSQSRVPEAWALLGGAGAIAWGTVRVGHIDTGYTEHPALGFPGATWIDQAMARTFVPPPSAGETPLPANPEPGAGRDNLDGFSAGHGTRMATTLCGYKPDAAGGPFHGVAPKVPLVPARITDTVVINNRQRQFREAVRHLIGPARVGVLNVSLGLYPSTVQGAMRDAINEAYDAGVIMVCAAGNIVNDVVAPARLSRTLAIGGVTAADIPWAGSSYGPETDLSSYAAGVRRGSVGTRGGYDFGVADSGTSYATAITSGAAALWLAHHGTRLAAQYPLPWHRVEAFGTVVRQTARVPGAWRPGAFGTGILDVLALLNAPLPPAASTPAPRA